MSGATNRRPTRPTRLRPDHLTIGRGRPPSASAIGRRRIFVGLAKRVLPLVALALLSLVALWPEIVQQADRARLIYLRAGLIPDSGVLTAPRYRGEDESRQPYTLTAVTARQNGPERVDLVGPVGDVTLNGNSWIHVTATAGTFLQKANQLDLAGEVILYRDDGSILITESVTLDIREGVAAGGNPVRVEGPFGTLDAQGFTITDRGHVAQFVGPARLVLNGSRP